MKNLFEESDIEFQDHPDGGATITFNVTPETRAEILRVTGKKRLTQKLMEKFVMDALQRYMAANGHETW